MTRTLMKKANESYLRLFDKEADRFPGPYELHINYWYVEGFKQGAAYAKSKMSQAQRRKPKRRGL